MARIAYPELPPADPRLAALLGGIPRLNIFDVMVHASGSARHAVTFVLSLWRETEISELDRELVILTVAQRCGSRYEATQHVPIASAAGATDGQIAAIAAGHLESNEFSERERALLALAAGIVDQPRLSDSAFADIEGHLSARQIVEVHLVVGAYWMIARLATNLDVDLEESFALRADVAAEDR